MKKLMSMMAGLPKKQRIESYAARIASGLVKADVAEPIVKAFLGTRARLPDCVRACVRL